MRVNIYAEEMTDRIQIISKTIEGQVFTGLRFYLELPVTNSTARQGAIAQLKALLCDHDGDVSITGSQMDAVHIKNALTILDEKQIQGPFMHHPGDDDSAAVTFWGKQDLRVTLRKALEMLDKHYEHQDHADDQTYPE